MNEQEKKDALRSMGNFLDAMDQLFEKARNTPGLEDWDDERIKERVAEMVKDLAKKSSVQ